MRLLLTCICAIAGGVLAIPLAGLLALSAALIIVALALALVAFGVWVCAFFVFDWMIEQMP